MDKLEQEAFVEAFANNVASVPSDRVADFVERYESGEDIEYSWDYTTIVDSLGIWHSAINFILKKGGKL